MLKKAKAEFGSKQVQQAKNLSQSILDSSHQIWLAGLGAFAKAQQGGMKVFDSLVRQGESLEAKTRTAAVETAEAARGAAKTKAKEMQAMAGDTWDKLEQVFENRVSRALGRLGVYSASDVERLTARVNELSEAVNALLKAQGIRRKRASPAEKMVKGAMKRATHTVSPATSTSARTVSTATRTGRRTLRTARKVAKAALK